jgi:hypothetical protein
MPMRTIATLQTLIVALVLGALDLSGAHCAEEPDPISITPANLRVRLAPNDIKQIKAHVDYWVSELSTVQNSGDIYTARENLLADYNKYGKNIRYQLEFARLAAASVPPAMQKLPPTDELKSMKEINYALVISGMTQLTTIDAIDLLVSHPNPGVRFLAWRSYREIRDDAIVAGGVNTAKLFASLKKRAAIESSPLVASVIVDVLYIKKSAWTGDKQKKAFEKNFAILREMMKPCCFRLMSGQTAWARPCAGAIPILKDADEFYKPDPKLHTVIVQQLIDIAQAGAKAFASAQGVGDDAALCVPLLTLVEPTIGAITNNGGTKFIRKPLFDKRKTPKQKTIAVRRGVLKWIDNLEDMGVKDPVFTPIKAPAATTQPAKVAN